ncbi:hypothetical protein H8959_022492 [Pygathrix nigripes]
MLGVGSGGKEQAPCDADGLVNITGYLKSLIICKTNPIMYAVAGGGGGGRGGVQYNWDPVTEQQNALDQLFSILAAQRNHLESPLLGHRLGSPQTDSHEPLHHVHGRQYYLHLPYYDAFKMLESSSQKFLQGLVYLIGNLMGLALAVYKCQSMGLLPTHASDWLAFIEPPELGHKNSVGDTWERCEKLMLDSAYT